MSSGGAVVVTGGSGGLGRAVVAALLDRGDRVAIPYRDAAAFEALRRSADAGASLWGAPADMGSLEAADRFMSAARREVGQISGLAALAGAWAGGAPLEKAPAEEWPRMLGANLQTAWATCRAALPHLLETKGSGVLVSARMVSAGGGAGAAAYVTAKAGVEALTRTLAEENRGRGVRFNAVAPGIIDTSANRKAMPDADRSAWVSPQQLAELVVWLLSPASAPLSGAVLPVEGTAA